MSVCVLHITRLGECNFIDCAQEEHAASKPEADHGCGQQRECSDTVGHVREDDTRAQQHRDGGDVDKGLPQAHQLRARVLVGGDLGDEGQVVDLHACPADVAQHRHHDLERESCPVDVHLGLRVVYELREVQGHIPDRQERDQQQHAAEDVQRDALA